MVDERLIILPSIHLPNEFASSWFLVFWLVRRDARVVAL
jgi:hypothetical protein